MSKIYNKSNIEIRAKQLLSPLRMACPDNVWHELSCQLNEQTGRTAANTKVYAPRILLAAIITIGIAALAIWKFSGDKFRNKLIHNATNNIVSAVAKGDVKPEKKDIVPPAVKPATTVLMTDSVKKTDKLPVSVAPGNSMPTSTMLSRTQKTTMKSVQRKDNQGASPLLVLGTKVTKTTKDNPSKPGINSKAGDPIATLQDNKAEDTMNLVQPIKKAFHDSVVNPLPVPSTSQDDSVNSNNTTN